MDVRDIQLVVVYGAPDCMNQLHQVRCINMTVIVHYVHVHVQILQLCGRAGRRGMASSAHLFFSPRQQKCESAVREYCTSKENCRRTLMLQALRVSESHPSSLPCCDACNNTPYPQTLNFMTTTSARRKRRTATKNINDSVKVELKAALMREVDAYIEDHCSYQMLGREFVCPECAIDKLCSEARFFRCIEDLDVVQLRP